MEPKDSAVSRLIKRNTTKARVRIEEDSEKKELKIIFGSEPSDEYFSPLRELLKVDFVVQLADYARFSYSYLATGIASVRAIAEALAEDFAALGLEVLTDHNKDAI